MALFDDIDANARLVAAGAALTSCRRRRTGRDLISEDGVSTTLYTWDNGMIAGRLL